MAASLEWFHKWGKHGRPKVVPNRKGRVEQHDKEGQDSKANLNVVEGNDQHVLTMTSSLEDKLGESRHNQAGENRKTGFEILELRRSEGGEGVLSADSTPS